MAEELDPIDMDVDDDDDGGEELPPAKTLWFRLSRHAEADGLKEVLARIEELELDTHLPLLKITPSSIDVMGNDTAKAKTLKRYETIWNGLRSFCYLIGDIDSAIILTRKHCPHNPPPVKLETAVNYLRFRVQSDDVVLTNTEDELVLTKDGEEIFCRGDWKGVSTVKLLQASLAKIHARYETTNHAYYKTCYSCIEAGTGCSIADHRNRPRLQVAGDPSKHADLKKAIAWAENYVLNHHKARAAMALLPGELRDLRSYLLGQNTLLGLMFWTIILLGTKLFGRLDDEILQMKVEHLNEYMNNWHVSADDVRGLTTYLRGKRDKTKMPLMIWDDRVCPEFDACKILLLWVYVSGVTSGYLFPARFFNRNADPDAPLSYRDFLGVIKDLCTTVLGKCPDLPSMALAILGTHMFRKTGYLLAYWGFIFEGIFHRKNEEEFEIAPHHLTSIVKSARHACIKTVATYVADSGTLLASMLRQDAETREKHRASPFQPINVSSIPLHHLVNQNSQRYLKPLHQLAKWFIEEVAGIQFRREHFKIREVADKICNLTRVGKPFEEVSKHLHDHIQDPVIRARVEESIRKYATTCAREASNALFLSDDDEAVPAALPPLAAPPAKKRKVGPSPEETVTFEEDMQQKINNARGVEKARAIVELVEGIKAQLDDGKVLVDPLKSFAYRAGKIHCCIVKCFGGNVEQFVENTSTLALTKFKCCRNETHRPEFKQHG